MKQVIAISIVLALATITACGNLGGTNLVFGQQHTVGIGIAGSGPSQEAELTLGYKDKNIAVVPVAIKKADGTIQELSGGRILEGEKGGSSRDAYSTFGQFEVNTKAGADGLGAGLGKFFATGQAAQTISQGFADKLAK